MRFFILACFIPTTALAYEARTYVVNKLVCTQATVDLLKTYGKVLPTNQPFQNTVWVDYPNTDYGRLQVTPKNDLEATDLDALELTGCLIKTQGKGKHEKSPAPPNDVYKVKKSS